MHIFDEIAKLKENVDFNRTKLQSQSLKKCCFLNSKKNYQTS